MKIITNNRKANFEYHVISKTEAGIILTGREVKHIRNHGSNLTGAFAKIINGQVFLFNMHVEGISVDSRKLLLHKHEIDKISKAIEKQGYTLIPLALYFNQQNILKVELAVCQGKKLHDKRAAIKERDLQRQQRSE